jgi:uncharacterized membrane protein YidH (DUF202 family)
MSSSEPPGLQRERTLLAWDRTGFVLLVGAALLLRAGGAPYIAVRHLPALFSMAVGGASFILADDSYRRGRAHGNVARTGHIGAVTVAAVVMGIDAVTLVLAGG